VAVAIAFGQHLRRAVCVARPITHFLHFICGWLALDGAIFSILRVETLPVDQPTTISAFFEFRVNDDDARKSSMIEG
jgi:hypothetical protein